MDPNEAVRALIERTLDELTEIGLTRSGAAELLVVQGAIRLGPKANRLALHDLIGWDDEDDGGDDDGGLRMAA